jgi:phenylacetate-coenzyme A ligase PaaK-like adenylate-forming protein
MSAVPSSSVGAWEPVSPDEPRADADHEARTVDAIARALGEVPFYVKRGHARPAPGAPLREVLAALPLLFKREARATLPKQWVPAGRDTRAELESGALALVETNETTGERTRVLWDAGWWPRQETRALRTSALLAAAMRGEGRPYREALLTTPATGLRTCNVGDLGYEERLEGDRLHLNQRPDPTFWTEEEQTRMLDELGRHATIVLEADPLHLATLARFAKARGRALDVAGAVRLTYGLTTLAELRAIRGAFAGPLLQLHRASDAGVLFVEGDDGRLHHAPFTTHVELLRARVPTPGARDVALVVATSLDRVAMPLVRWVVGDLVQVDAGGPPRFTTVAPLASVEGRLDDALVRPDGALVTAGALDRAAGDVEGVRVWQANQRTPNEVEIDVVADGDSARALGAVRERVAPLLAGLEVAVRSASAIPIEPSGKFRVSKRHFPVDVARAFEPV